MKEIQRIVWILSFMEEFFISHSEYVANSEVMADENHFTILLTYDA